jgi:hypothetical protein
MYRAALFTLLAASVLTTPALAQHGGGGHGGGGGGHAGGSHVSGSHPATGAGPTGFGGHRGGGHPASRRFAPERGTWNNYGYGGVGNYPYVADDWYDEPDGEAPADSAATPQPVVEQRVTERRQVKPLPPAQVIEIPHVATSAVPKALPPTVFILTSGERLEGERFVLTANSLSINAQRIPRTIPLDMINIDATLAANRDRGIDLRIPNDRNEISLRF